MFLKNFLLKSVCVVLVLSIIMPMCIFAKDTSWEDAYYEEDKLYTQMRPIDGYTSAQNPPSFRWAKTDGATYEFIVAKDKDLKDIVYKKELNQNLFLPEVTFETGVSLYWSVRFIVDGNESSWSRPRCFKITANAQEFVVPEVDELLSRIPDTHPRLFVQKENLEEFRSYKDKYPTAKYIYDSVISTSDLLVSNNIIEKEPEDLPEGSTAEEWEAYRVKERGHVSWNFEKAFETGFAYLLTGDLKYADYAKRCLLEYTTWNAETGLSSFKMDEQVARAICWQGATVYDWIYDTLTEEERTSILNMLSIRMKSLGIYTDMLEKWNWNSMGWTSYGFLPIAAIATYGELPESETILRQQLPGYIALYPNWSYQDGGWGQGTGYCWWSMQTNHQAISALASSGVVNLYDTIWQRRNYNWNLYQQPYNASGNFGDGAGEHDMTEWMVYNNMHDIHFGNDEFDGYRKWIAEQAGGIKKAYYHRLLYCLAPSYDETEAVAPYEEPSSYMFKDAGFISMLSDVADPNRVQIAFRSSPHGTSVHNHSDQNGIFIEGFGQRLSQHAGIYETLSYGSQHHSNVVRATWAHNTITVDNKGQADGTIEAQGKITGFLHQQDFDLAMGDATDAYMGELGLYERSVLYLRPDMIVVIDDLKAKEGQKSSFQWWLNAKTKMEYSDEEDTARIIEGGAMLDATAVYPKEVVTHYSDKFAGPDGVEYPPVTIMEPHKRVWFDTEKVDSTKMVVTLDVHPGTKEKRNIDTKYYDKYIKMTFEDGTLVYVNLGEPGETVTTSEGWTFTGRALAVAEESIMLVKGVNVKHGASDIIVLENEGSVVVGKNELSISTLEDNNISLNTSSKYVGKINKVTDFYGEDPGVTYKSGKLITNTKEIKKYNLKRQIETEIIETTEIKPSKDFVTFSLISDHYQFMLNGKKIETKELEGTTNLIINGEVTEIPTKGYISRSGETIYNGYIKLDEAKYIVEEVSDDLIPGSLSVTGEVINLTEIDFTTSSPEGSYVKLHKVEMKDCEVKTVEDYDAIKENLAWFSESEDWNTAPGGVAKYTTRAFLSGGTGVQYFDDIGTQMTYKVDVPEDGVYNFVIKYVAWGYEEILPTRAIYFNDKKFYKFTTEKTKDFGSKPEIWRACVLDADIELKKGENLLTIEALNTGMWNMDWIGLIKKQ